jgi:hypothetical protein
MASFRIDTSAYEFVVMNATPDQIMERDDDGKVTDKPVADKDTGEVMFKVTLGVHDPEADRADQWAVKVAGCPDVSVFDRVDVEGLVARPYLMNGRDGITFRAQSITRKSTATKPAPAPTGKSATDKAAA